MCDSTSHLAHSCPEKKGRGGGGSKGRGRKGKGKKIYELEQEADAGSDASGFDSEVDETWVQMVEEDVPSDYECGDVEESYDAHDRLVASWPTEEMIQAFILEAAVSNR